MYAPSMHPRVTPLDSRLEVRSEGRDRCMLLFCLKVSYWPIHQTVRRRIHTWTECSSEASWKRLQGHSYLYTWLHRDATPKCKIPVWAVLGRQRAFNKWHYTLHREHKLLSAHLQYLHLSPLRDFRKIRKRRADFLLRTSLKEQLGTEEVYPTSRAKSTSD